MTNGAQKHQGRVDAKEVERFFKQIGLGSEKERLEFKKFESPAQEVPNEKYETRLTNDTKINYGELG